MALYVKKFGGSSVATPEKMKFIAQRVIRDKKENDKIVIVAVSYTHLTLPTN